MTHEKGLQGLKVFNVPMVGDLGDSLNQCLLSAYYVPRESNGDSVSGA